MVHGMFISFTIKLLSRSKIVNMCLSFLAHLYKSNWNKNNVLILEGKPCILGQALFTLII